jgi:hypothetical protein
MLNPQLIQVHVPMALTGDTGCGDTGDQDQDLNLSRMHWGTQIQVSHGDGSRDLPRVRPETTHPNISKQYDLFTRGMDTLAIRSDFDFKCSGFWILI